MELAVKTRDVLGKKVKALRREGLIPAELYGHGFENIHLALPTKEFNKVLKEAGSTSVVTLVLGKETKPAMIHEVARDAVTSEIIHVDLHQVRMDETVKAHVPLEFVGEAPAIKAFAAVINKAMSEIEVEAFPQNLPHSLTVDLSVLDEMDKTIYVKDLVIPKGVTVLVDEEMAIATATPPAPEEVAAPVEEVDVSAITTEGEEKKAERDAAKEEKKEE
ncbi:MAG TPA: 50S ribosomal protein L25 [Candidatus Paceibacterota bacterium]|nr:50S ribosomal protein L25 [Candidatus Paceibacterota bacterium]